MTNTATQGSALITGGNRGIGYATALSLAKRNIPIIFTSRDAARGQASAEKIKSLIPGAQVEVLALDLASMASIRAFAAAFLARGTPLRALINNAGAMGLGKTIEFTQDGFETEFGTNHLGHFLLTCLLMPALQAMPGSRVISVASIRHIPGKGGIGARFDFDNLKGEKSYEPRMSYNNTKLANVWFAYELQRRMGDRGLVSIAACPGFVPETLAVSRTGLSRFVYTRLLPLIPGARPASVSGEELAALAVDPAYAKEGGTFHASGKKIPSSPASYDESSARRLWELSEKLTGIDAAHDWDTSPGSPLRILVKSLDPLTARVPRPFLCYAIEANLRPGGIVNKLKHLWCKPERICPSLKVNIQGVVADKLPNDCDTRNRWCGLAINLTDQTSHTQCFGLRCRKHSDVIPEGDV